MKLNITFLLFLSLLFGFSACKKDKDETYTIPTTYNFENVNYSGQTQRIGMLTEIKEYMATASTGAILDAEAMKAQYANGTTAVWMGSYETSKQLKGKTAPSEQNLFDSFFDSLAVASTSNGMAGSNGQAGLVSSADNSNTYLLSAQGLDYPQLIEKGLMGACLYYQATTIYLGADRMSFDNEIVEEGTGTAMEHHWDESFGYFGVGPTFPTDTDGILFWGKYSNNRNSVLGSNQKIMDAYLKGRAAISNNDLISRDDAILAIRNEWEKVAVGSVIHYLNETIGDNFNDMALRGHFLSEAIGFLYSLKFNEGKVITNATVDQLITLIAGSSDFNNMNLYQTVEANLISAKDQLATIYSFNDIKDQF